MLLFSTILPIKDALTKEAFINLVIEWNQGSPHESNRIPNLVWNGDMNTRFGDDRLWMQIEEYRNKNIVAVRYEKTEVDGVVWDTDYVMNFNDMKMSVRLDRSYLEEALTVNPAFSTPAFIQLLIDRGYVKDDGDMPIGRHPVFITDDNLQLIANVINGTVRYHLPVVYISRPYSNQDSVDIRDMAKRLKGIAHVLVQQSSWSGPRLREMTDSKNEFDGAIGIYFPSHAIGHEKFLRHVFPGSDEKLAAKVIRRVLQYSTSQRTDTLYTWPGVNNALLRDRYSSKREELAASQSAIRLAQYEASVRVQSADQELERMRQQAEAEKKRADEYAELVDSVDEDLASMQKQIEDLTKQNEALTAEVQGRRAKMDAMSSVPLLCFGGEDELFPDEIKEFVLGALQHELDGTEGGTRKADALGDVIRANGGFKDVSRGKAERLKNALRGYKNLSNKQKRVLEELGFTLTLDGDHYKAVYWKDERYMATLACTPSDHRDGMNIALEIIKDML